MPPILTYACLIAGFLLIVLPVNYYWWTQFRPVRFREDVLAKRDELFDATARLHLLSDPAYEAANTHLISLADLADVLSVAFVTSLVKQLPTGETLPFSANRPELQQLLDETYAWSATRTVAYLYKESIAGYFVSLLAKIFVHVLERNPALMKHLKPEQAKLVEQFVRSGFAQDLRSLKQATAVIRLGSQAA